MVDSTLRDRIKGNRFAYHLLEKRIDKTSYGNLCEALRELSGDWSTQQMIEKDLVFFLCETISIVRNVLEELRQQNQVKMAETLEDMHVELDRLIMEECLQAGR